MAEYEGAGGELLDAEIDSSSLTAYVSAEIDTQIATAKKYPRSIKQFKQSAMELACLDEETAASMFYKLPRGGKKIEGPTIRFAEIIAMAFKNLRHGARVVEIGDKFITAQGVCHDMESNNAGTMEVKRRITNKDNVRFNADMIQTTCNAACSIALRGAIFKVVPFALCKDIYEQAKLTSIGKAKSMKETRAKMVQWFVQAGADEKAILTYLGKPSVDDVNTDDLIDLRGLVTAIKDGEITIEEALKPKSAESGAKVSTSPLTKKNELTLTADWLKNLQAVLGNTPTEQQVLDVGKNALTAAKNMHDRKAINDLTEARLQQIEQLAAEALEVIPDEPVNEDSEPPPDPWDEIREEFARLTSEKSIIELQLEKSKNMDPAAVGKLNGIVEENLARVKDAKSKRGERGNKLFDKSQNAQES